MTASVQISAKSGAVTKQAQEGADKGAEANGFASLVPWLVGAVLLVGWVLILHVNDYRFVAPVVLLFGGWLGLVFTVALIFKAALSVVGEDEGEIQTLDIRGARRHELLAEKRSLLVAIREIEFDRDLGKMSSEDASEMVRYYRARAIEVIKELEGKEDKTLSVEERIAAELEVRMEIAKKSKSRNVKSKESSSVKAEVGTTEAKPGTSIEDEGNASESAKADKKQESKDE